MNLFTLPNLFLQTTPEFQTSIPSCLPTISTQLSHTHLKLPHQKTNLWISRVFNPQFFPISRLALLPKRTNHFKYGTSTQLYHKAENYSPHVIQQILCSLPLKSLSN